MKKTIIFVGLLSIGIAASFGILRAMDGGNSQSADVMSEVTTQPRLNSTVRTHAAQPLSKVHQHSDDALMIKGRVLDRRGNPAKAIDVIIARPTGMLLLAKTNADGYFSFKGMAAGTYEVYTKDSDGPECPTCLFYSGGIPSPTFATLSLSREEATPSIVLQTPPKLGKLKGSVVDADTKAPLLASRIMLRRTDNPEYAMEIGLDEEGSFEIPIPTVPVTLEVKCAEYESWSYFDSNFPIAHRSVNSLKLRIGESRKLEIRLRKINFNAKP